jgi:predicted Rossmann fold flavoprotein
MLLDECAVGGVEIRTGCKIASVRRGARFVVESDQGAFESETLTIASGGLSIPKLGASSFAYDIASQFSVPLIPTRPGLVPLTFGESDLAWMRPLSGVSAIVVARTGNATFREAALFTHRGLSGPAILQASSYWRAGEEIIIDWLPDADEGIFVTRKRARPKAQLKGVLAEFMSERMAAALLASPAPGGEGKETMGDIKDATLIEAVRALKAWPLTPTGTEGYAKAEVTVGGIDTNALSQQTMEVRGIPGLFFIGEAVDVTGWLGGYNFQWAWSSGWAAGMAA